MHQKSSDRRFSAATSARPAAFYGPHEVEKIEEGCTPLGTEAVLDLHLVTKEVLKKGALEQGHMRSLIKRS